MNPAVSVVIASYNYGRFLPLALDSAIAQTLKDIEVIVVDDGSTDETARVVQPYLADPRIRYQRLAHRGQPAAKNSGICAARGSLIAFLDADDVWLPTKLERQFELFETSRVGVVFCRRIYIGEDGRRLQRRERPVHRGDVLEAIFRQNFVCFSSAVVRKAVLDEVGLFDESIPLAIDYDLWLRVASHYHFDYVDEPLVKYRTGHANLSTRKHERLRIARLIMDRFLDDHGGRALLPGSVIRRARAELCCDMAWASESKLAALASYLQALRYVALYWPAWRGLATSWWPAVIKSGLRSKRRRADHLSSCFPIGSDESR